MTIHVSLDRGERDVPNETPLYKYMCTEAFLHLIESRKIIFTRLTSWPDAFEGFSFEFLKRHRTDPILQGVSREELYGSCWTLQTEDSALYKRPQEFHDAQKDIEDHGIAPMWETYCRNGGVRIRTTQGKLTALLESKLPDTRIVRGKVRYAARDRGLHVAMDSHGTARALFVKRVAFRYETEYRYMSVPSAPLSSDTIAVSTGELYDLLDEILIAPATKSRAWAARTLHSVGVRIASGPSKSGTNTKNGHQFCRISQLYSMISESISLD